MVVASQTSFDVCRVTQHRAVGATRLGCLCVVRSRLTFRWLRTRVSPRSTLPKIYPGPGCRNREGAGALVHGMLRRRNADEDVRVPRRPPRCEWSAAFRPALDLAGHRIADQDVRAPSAVTHLAGRRAPEHLTAIDRLVVSAAEVLANSPSCEPSAFRHRRDRTDAPGQAPSFRTGSAWRVDPVGRVFAMEDHRVSGTTLKGAVGEYRVWKWANTLLPRPRYIHFHDLWLATPTSKTQIDHVFLSRMGVFVVETKNYEGWIHGKPGDDNWTQTFANGIRCIVPESTSTERMACPGFGTRARTEWSRHREPALCRRLCRYCADQDRVARQCDVR